MADLVDLSKVPAMFLHWGKGELLTEISFSPHIMSNIGVFFPISFISCDSVISAEEQLSFNLMWRLLCNVPLDKWNCLAIAMLDLVLSILCAKTSHSLQFPPVKVLQDRGCLWHRTVFCCLSRSDMHCSGSANKNSYNQYLNLGTVVWLFCFWDHFTNLVGNSYEKKVIPLKKHLSNNISPVNRDYFCNKAISVDVVIMG